MNAYRHLHAPEDGFVFLVTYGRSGSTLTQNLLNAIPGYVIRGENGNLTHFFSRAIDIVANDDMYRWRREDLPKPRHERRPYLRPILGKPFDPWAGAERVDPDDFALSLMDLFVKKVLRPPKDCRVSGFKEIRFHEDPPFFRKHMDVLRTVFPKARIIFQHRKLEDVARSGWWKNQPQAEVISQLGQADRMFLSYAKDHPDCCHVVSYDKLVADKAHAREIYDFLGEKFDEAAVAGILGQALKH